MKSHSRHIFFTLWFGSLLTLVHADSPKLLQLNYGYGDLRFDPSIEWVQSQLNEPTFGVVVWEESLYDDNHANPPKIKPLSVSIVHSPYRSILIHRLSLLQLKTIEAKHIEQFPFVHLLMQFPPTDREVEFLS